MKLIEDRSVTSTLQTMDKEEVGIGLSHVEIGQFEQDYTKLAAYSKFQLLQFESLIRKQHQSVAERLWRLVVIKGNLFNHLQVHVNPLFSDTNGIFNI